MSKLEFVKKLYNGKNCYSDHMTAEELNLLHISSKVEELICEMLYKGKIVFLTGNPGDGKTFIIKAIQDVILQQLDDNGLAEENDDGEVILANRRKSYKKSVFIQDGKYGFEEE